MLQNFLHHGLAGETARPPQRVFHERFGELPRELFPVIRHAVPQLCETLQRGPVVKAARGINWPFLLGFRVLVHIAQPTRPGCGATCREESARQGGSVGSAPADPYLVRVWNVSEREREGIWIT